jgi:hypothetical protein
MPITLAKIASNTADLTFTWGEDTIHLTYYPGRVTEKVLADMQAMNHLTEAASEEAIMQSFTDFNTMLANLIKSWDVFVDEEQTVMFPLEAGRMDELPFFFRMQLIQSILADIRPEMIAPQKTS